MKTKLLIASLLSVALLAGCGEESNNISLVQDGVLPTYTTSITVGNMLNGYHYASNPKWAYSKGERGEKIVTFTADLHRSEEAEASLAKTDEEKLPYVFFTKSNITVQFMVDIDGKGFTLKSSEVEVCWKDNKCSVIPQTPVEDYMKKIVDQKPLAILDGTLLGHMVLMPQYNMRKGPAGTAL